jgi:uncharacterized membrane protein YeaQ/YmgE (transglycosylase-associated protein family)
MKDLKDIIPRFLAEGWVVIVIGTSGMIARLIVSKEEEQSVVKVLKNIIASMITSLIAWFILEQYEMDSIYKALVYGLVGLNSPEIITGIIKIGGKFAADPFAFINNFRKNKEIETKTKAKARKTTKKPQKK